MDINPILNQLGTYPIAEVRARAQDRIDRGLPVIDFSIGDPIEPTPGFIADALRDGVPEISQYPTAAGRSDLREAIAAYVNDNGDITVTSSGNISTQGRFSSGIQ